MPLEHSNEKTSQHPGRAVAHQPHQSAISRPAVPTIQRISEDKVVEDQSVMDGVGGDVITPAKFTLPVDSRNDTATRSGVQPFQLRPDNTGLSVMPLSQPALPAFPVIQQKKLLIAISGRRNLREASIEIDHRRLMTAVKLNKVWKYRGEFSLNIDTGTRRPRYVPVEALITAVESALSGMEEDMDRSQDEDENISGELNTLLKRLVELRDGVDDLEKDKPKEQPNKRKRVPDRSLSRDRKKRKQEKRKKPGKRNEQEEDRQDEDSREDEAIMVGVQKEEAIKPVSPDEALKFVAWNANHFGEGNDLDEKGIIARIESFKPHGKVKDLKKLKKYKYTPAQIGGFLETLNKYAAELPVFTNTTAVNELMDAVNSLKYILDREAEESSFYKDKLKQIEEIGGSLKKHYMLEHSRNLLKLHPTLVMGYNEVGKGVNTMKGKLERKGGSKRKGGIQVEKGPRLQSVSISVDRITKAISTHNETIDSDETEVEQVSKKKRYGKNDRRDHHDAYQTLGGGDDYLRNGQVEYYPIAFNSEVFEYRGSMIVSGTTIKEDETEVPWTKNPLLTDYVLYRPIVVHRLALKTDKEEKKGNDDMEESEKNDENEVWYGMVHTTPDGDEFDRRDIYEEQLSKSIPALRDRASSKKAQLIIGGDYYIAEEALITKPPVLRTEGKKYKTALPDVVKMKTAEIKARNLQSNRSIGKSRIFKSHKIREQKRKDRKNREHKKKLVDKSYITGKLEQVRNMAHPTTGKPYNFKNTLEDKKLKDVRSLTGTNENTLGLQSADYFIVDTETSKTYQTGIIDPVTGIPYYIESDNREMSDAWFSFSDHVPVMLVVSAKENDQSVGNAFANNKGYFNDDPFSLNLFDLRFLQISNAMARMRDKESPYSKEDIAFLEKDFAVLQKIRKTGKPTQKDLIEMNTLKDKIDKFTKSNKQGLDIAMEMFEVYQAREAYITTILYQIWSDIEDVDGVDNQSALLDHINDVRMILKEEMIYAAYTTGLDKETDEKKYAEKLLAKRLKKKTLARMNDKKMSKDEMIKLKAEFTDELLDGILADIGHYIDKSEEEESRDKRNKQENISSNYKLLTELVGNARTTHIMRKDHERSVPDVAYYYNLRDTTDELESNGGIPNRGNDCFLNSLCQLLTLPAYQNLSLDTKVRTFVDKIGTPEKIRRIDVWELRLYLYTLNRVKTMGGQEDAAELFGKLMDEINPVLIDEEDEYEDMFKILGSYKRTIISSEQRPRNKPIDNKVSQWVDNKKTTNEAPENILNIPIDRANGLEKWLRQPPQRYTFKPKYSNINTIEWAAMNDQWHSVLEMEEAFMFRRLPATLTIALKRFGNDLEKNDKTFNMPQTFHQPSNDGEGVYMNTYELQGFIYHQGDTGMAGHYWTHKKVNDTWMKAEDAKVGPSDMDNDWEGTFQYDVDNAYIYTYERTGRVPFEEWERKRDNTGMELQDDEKGRGVVKDNNDDSGGSNMDLVK